MAISSETLYSQYLSELDQKLNWLEKLTDRATGVDDRLDIIARIQIEQLRIFASGIPVTTKAEALPISITIEDKKSLENADLIAYTIKEFPLTSARSDYKVTWEGRFLYGWVADGVLDNMGIKLNNQRSEILYLNRFNPIPFPFTQFYLTTPAVSGKILYLLMAKMALSPGAITAIEPTRTEVPIANTEGKVTEAAGDYQTLATWTVSVDKNGILYGVELYASSFSAARFKLTIGGTPKWTDIEFPTALTIPFSAARLAATTVVLLEGKSGTGASVDMWGHIEGKEVG